MSAHAIVPVGIYVMIFTLLMVLTGLTVFAAYQDLGPWSTAVALTIAVTKTLLVVLYFMHVRYSSRLVAVFAMAGVVWLITLIGYTLTDFLTR